MPTVEDEVEALQRMKTGELADLYERLHGQPCRTRHRQYLIRKNAWRIQANAYGDLSIRARRRAIELANDADIRVMAPKTMISPPQHGVTTVAILRVPTEPPRDSRLPPPGSALVREYKGMRVRVVVLADDQGFECG